MELRRGYQSTDIGALPTEWELVPFSELLEFRNGVNADKAAYGDGVRFINVLEVITKSHLCASDIPGRISLPDRSLESYAVHRGDIVFNRTSETQEEVGLAAVYNDDEKVVFGGFVIRGRPTEAAALDTLYSGYALRSTPIRRQVVARGQGAIRANIGQQDLRSVLVPRPPIAEQKAIAAALSDVDALLGALDRLIAKKRDLKQAAMQQLLTGQTRMPGFSGRWEITTLGSVAKMSSGGTPPTNVAHFYDGDVPWVSISDITREGKYLSTTERHLTQAGLENSAATIFPVGTVLYAMYASIGECSISRVPAASSQAILGIRPGGRLSNEYLYYWLCRYRTTIKSWGQQGAQANLNAGMIRSFELTLPSIEEQAAISRVLADIDNDLTLLKHRRDKTRLLKQGMMQELLTGRMRLV